MAQILHFSATIVISCFLCLWINPTHCSYCQEVDNQGIILLKCFYFESWSDLAVDISATMANLSKYETYFSFQINIHPSPKIVLNNEFNLQELNKLWFGPTGLDSVTRYCVSLQNLAGFGVSFIKPDLTNLTRCLDLLGSDLKFFNDDGTTIKQCDEAFGKQLNSTIFSFLTFLY
jgi:hypothetical protein